MKLINSIFFTWLLMGSQGLIAQPLIEVTNMGATNQTIEITKVEWVTQTHNFGELKQGHTVSKDFEFTNIGESPLVIKDVITSCGCTASNFPSSPVQINEKANITISYDAKKLGYFSKTIIVKTNTPDEIYRLKISGTVKE